MSLLALWAAERYTQSKSHTQGSVPRPGTQAPGVSSVHNGCPSPPRLRSLLAWLLILSCGSLTSGFTGQAGASNRARLGTLLGPIRLFPSNPCLQVGHAVWPHSDALAPLWPCRAPGGSSALFPGSGGGPVAQLSLPPSHSPVIPTCFVSVERYFHLMLPF